MHAGNQGEGASGMHLLCIWKVEPRELNNFCKDEPGRTEDQGKIRRRSARELKRNDEPGRSRKEQPGPGRVAGGHKVEKERRARLARCTPRGRKKRQRQPEVRIYPGAGV